jgi:hypothetical protein
MLKGKILNKQPGILTYGITPPKVNTDPDKVKEISQKQIERIGNLDIDGLLVYHVQDEMDRAQSERPFPYIQSIEPTSYSRQYLGELKIPKIIYRCVGNYTESELSDWLTSDIKQEQFSVFVGASSSGREVKLGLSDAYSLATRLNPDLIFGGVVIPERHSKKHDEHIRVVNKAGSGCKFFVSQATYDVEASKDFLSDYYYYCDKNEIEMVPILFNIAPCGSEKTLAFMKWLGISFPKWLENDLMHANDILDKSVDLTRKVFEELFEFGLEKGIPVGCSVESVSTRKIEIEASIQLVNDIKQSMARKLKS